MSKWFSETQDPALFKCQCGRPECDAPAPTQALLDLLDAFRDTLMLPVKINSGPRCAFWNARQGGNEKSEHLTGEGADLACVTSGMRFLMIYAVTKLGIRRFGIGKNFLHVGVSLNSDQDVCWHYYPKETT